MPFSMHLRNSCLLPAETSVLSSDQSQSLSSIKLFLRHYFSKKQRSTITQHQQQQSTRRFQRIKGSNIVREINSNHKFHSKSEKINNYDMTILHDDELDNTQLAKRRRHKKKIPSWANKDQLQLAVINQVYFQDKNPEDIFGSVCIDDVLRMFNSIEIKNNESKTSMVVSRYFV